MTSALDVPAYTEAQEQKELIRLHLNEHALTPLPSVARAIDAAARQAHQYPDFFPDALAGAIARWCRVPEEQVVVGNGSVGVALQLLHAVQRPGGRLVYAWRNFDAYPLLARMTKATPVPTPLKPGGHQDLAALHDALSPDTTAVILCNPHNPTGTLIDPEALADFLDSVPLHITVLLDEAYIEFAGPGRADSLEMLPRHPNLVVLRTFSKAYGLAGMRIGYAIAHPALAQAARAQQLPFGITKEATAAVHASLAATADLRSRIHTITRTRDKLYGALIEQGWNIPYSHANFLWLDHPKTAELAHLRLHQAGFHTRLYRSEGLRVTVPAAAQVPRIVEALGTVSPD